MEVWDIFLVEYIFIIKKDLVKKISDEMFRQMPVLTHCTKRIEVERLNNTRKTYLLNLQYMCKYTLLLLYAPMKPR